MCVCIHDYMKYSNVQTASNANG